MWCIECLIILPDAEKLSLDVESDILLVENIVICLLFFERSIFLSPFQFCCFVGVYFSADFLALVNLEILAHFSVRKKSGLYDYAWPNFCLGD